MKYIVNFDCIGCGVCVSTCPEVFFISDSGKAETVIKDHAPYELESDEAMSLCPVSAIEKH